MYDKEASSCIKFHIAQHEKYNVDNPYVVTSLHQTPIFEWYVVWCDSKNGYERHVFYKKLGCMLKI